MDKKKLIYQIRIANSAYAKGSPIMGDEEYDELWRQLRELEPDNPMLWLTSKDLGKGYPEVKHTKPRLSLNKAFDITELKAFHIRFNQHTIKASPKLDGVAAVYYNWEKLVLYGDGYTGRDISHLIPHMDLSRVAKPIQSVELVIPWSKWDDAYGTHPRNVVAGWVAKKKVTQLDIEALPHGEPHKLINMWEISLESLWEELLIWYDSWYEYCVIDGIVLEVTDENTKMSEGHNGSFPLWAIAWKPPIKISTTKVTDISWSVGRTGRVAPTVLFEPILISGATITRASGHNADWIKRHKIGKRAKIKVGRAGEENPKKENEVTSVDEVELPDMCPGCGSALEWEGVDLVCRQPTCDGSLLSSLVHFYGTHGFDVKGIAENTFVMLLDDPHFKDKLSSRLWYLLLYRSFSDDEWARLYSILGDGRFTNLLTSLRRSSATRDAAHLMAALASGGLGYQTSLALLQHNLYNTPLKKRLSTKATRAFGEIIPTWIQALKELKESDYQINPVPNSKGIRFCITGGLEVSRNEAKFELAQKGWDFASSVTQDLDYLIVGDVKYETTKMKKAKSLGVEFITYDEALRIANEKMETR